MPKSQATHSHQNFLKGYKNLSPKARKMVSDGLVNKKDDLPNFDLTRFTDDLTEGLNTFIIFHPMATVLERIFEKGVVGVPEDILALTTKMDEKVAEYVKLASLLFELGNKVLIQVDQELIARPNFKPTNRNRRILNLMYRDPLSDRIPELLDLTIQIQDDISTPILKFLDLHKEIVDEEYRALGKEYQSTSDFDLRRQIHMDRISNLVDLSQVA